MCDLCVIESVKQRMMTESAISRRDMLRGAVTGAVTGTVAGAAVGMAVTAPQALAAGHGRVEDMTHELSADFPTYFGTPGIAMEPKFTFAENGFNLMQIDLNEHTGTHVDAPLHFSADGQAVNEIPVENLICPLVCVDIRAKADASSDAQVTPDDLKAWIAAHGPIPDKACVAMLSGWGPKSGGDAFRNADDEGKMHFPGFHVDAASMLIEETGAVGLAVDTLSLDHGISADFAAHYAWLPTNRWGVECLANLEKVPAAGATLVVGAPKHRGGTGGPARIFAMV